MKSYFVHEKALVESKSIGEGTRIWAFAHILEGAKIGENCNIGDHCYIESETVVGNDVVIKNGVSIWNRVAIEDNVFIGPNVVFTNDPRPRSKVYLDGYTPTLVGRGASIGANATLLCGIVVGEYAMVGAGSVVTRDVSPYALVYGNPARVKGHVCECAKRLRFAESRAKCECGREYLKTEAGIKLFGKNELFEKKLEQKGVLGDVRPLVCPSQSETKSISPPFGEGWGDFSEHQ